MSGEQVTLMREELALLVRKISDLEAEAVEKMRAAMG